MSNEPLHWRLDNLERRLRRLEERLDLTEPEIVEPTPVVPVLPLSVDVAAEPADGVEPPAAPRPAAVPPPLPVMPARAARVVPMYQAPASPAPVPAVTARPGWNFEQLVGQNWTGWIGAIVLVIGAALGIKYAYDVGWLGGLRPEWKLVFCFAAGFALLAAGEWVDRRIDRISAACVLGAGVATLFVVSYAGFGYFELYHQSTAFVLMGVATFVGCLIAWRKNLVAIAALAVIGGNVAPIVLQTATPNYVGLLTYVLLLQGLALTLTAIMPGGKWWILRGLAILTPALWTTLTFAESAIDPMIPLRFALLYAALAQAELVLAGARLPRFDRGLAGVTSTLITSLFTMALLVGLQPWALEPRGGAVLALAAVLGVAGWLLRSHPSGLSLPMRLQAAALVLVAVPVALSGLPATVAFAALSLVYALVGRSLRSAWGGRFAVAAWFSSIGYLIYDAPVLPQVAGMPAYFLAAAALMVVGHALSRFMGWRETASDTADTLAPSRAFSDRSAIALDIVASAVFIVAAMLALDPWHATAGIVGYAWLLFLAGRTVQRPAWIAQAAGLLLLATAKWGAADMLAGTDVPSFQAAKYLPVVNPLMGVGTLIAGSIVGFYALAKRELQELAERHRGGSSLPIVVATLVIAILTFGLSVEVLRAVEQLSSAAPWRRWHLMQFGWTMLWSAALAVHGFLVVKLMGDDAPRRRWLAGSTALLMLVAAKCLFFDLLVVWFDDGVADALPVANLQVLSATIVAAALGLLSWLRHREGLHTLAGGGAILALLLLVGTIEIDRFFTHGNVVDDARFATQMGISIWWALFAVASIIAGFRLRLAGLRYFGLGLLAVALAKVVIIDLQEIGRGYRILSFLGLGGLMLATSVIYGKVSPKLLRQSEAPGTIA